ncbi:hypothetical protein [Oryzomicrobium sp.]|uniref:hypothetical protein n=1 Tax=Oryzomicrobium sp. TaxID=1911578 RepID=UPI0025EEB31E|nr:hypothetical protein [Oryzomicrobium sp.]MCE1244103.1 hypothetical protein [Oryzomicrobium sp.]
MSRPSLFRRLFAPFFWIAEDMAALGRELRRAETWGLIGMLLLFGLMLGLGLYYGLKVDFTLKLRQMASFSCSDVGNWQAVGIFYGAIVFALAAFLAFGEYANYVDTRRRGQRAGNPGRATLLLGLLALVVGGGLVWFLAQFCG